MFTLVLKEDVRELSRRVRRERYLWRGFESQGGNKKRAPKQDMLVREGEEGSVQMYRQPVCLTKEELERKELIY